MSPLSLLNIVILWLSCQNKCLGKFVSQLFARKDLLSNTPVTDLPLFSHPGCRSRLECSVTCSGNQECVSFFYNSKTGQCAGHAVQLSSTDLGAGSVYYTRVNEDPTCPPGFTGFKSSCYLFPVVTANYAEAESFCQASDSRLAEVTSLDEELFIRDYVKTNGAGFSHFISGTDLRDEGIWTWENPVRNISYLNWYPGEPNSSGPEHCLNLFNDNGYMMNDGSCEHIYRFVCEKEL